MPIPNVGATAAAAPDRVGAIADRTTAAAKPAAAAQAHGWFVRTAAVAAEDVAQLFGGLKFGVFKTAAPAAPSPAGSGSPQP
jgi:hypothetical protein